MVKCLLLFTETIVLTTQVFYLLVIFISLNEDFGLHTALYRFSVFYRPQAGSLGLHERSPPTWANINSSADTMRSHRDALLMHPDALLMQPDALLMQLDALLMHPDALLMQLDALLMQPDALLMQPDALLMQPDAMRSQRLKLLHDLCNDGKYFC